MNLQRQFLKDFIACSWNSLVICMSTLHASTEVILFIMKSRDTFSLAAISCLKERVNSVSISNPVKET